MSVSGLVLSLAALRDVARAVAQEVPKATRAIEQHTTDIMRDSGSHADGDDTLHYQEGPEEERLARVKKAKDARGNFGIHSLQSGASVVEAARKVVQDHVEKAKKDFTDATEDAVHTFGDFFDKRDKTLQELLKYMSTRVGQGFDGAAALMTVINGLKQIQEAQKNGDAFAYVKLKQSLEITIDVINKFLLGPANQKGKLDMDRLLGAFRDNDFTPSSSTGHMP
jgi:hypothetical protein